MVGFLFPLDPIQGGPSPQVLRTRGGPKRIAGAAAIHTPGLPKPRGWRLGLGAGGAACGPRGGIRGV